MFSLRSRNSAEGLGLRADGGYRNPTVWSKWNPVLRLDHDGSSEAELLRLELLRLGVPHRVNRYASQYGLSNNNHLMAPPMFDDQAILVEIREIAVRYQEQLDSIS